MSGNARLEDFGAMGLTVPIDGEIEYVKDCVRYIPDKHKRKHHYQESSRKMHPNRQAPFWLTVHRIDHEVAELNGVRKRGGRKK